jgi:hypothetical protein
VWPVKAMPASLIVLFCTGAVTIASNSARTQPVDGPVEERDHVGAVRGIEATGNHRRRDRDGRGARPQGARLAPRVVGRVEGDAPQARTRADHLAVADDDETPGDASPASIAHRSGPMPAGSPAVSAISGGARHRASAQRSS